MFILKTHTMPEKGAVGLCPNSKPQNLRPTTSTRRFTRRKVLKMLAVMEPQQTTGEPVTSHSQEFLTSGRTGRRNALPDILSEHAVVSSADLPARLQKLSTKDGAGPSTEAGAPGPSGKEPNGSERVNSGS